MQTSRVSVLSYASYTPPASELAEASSFAESLALAMSREREERAEAEAKAQAEYEAFLKAQQESANAVSKASESTSATGLEALFGSKENLQQAILLLCSMMASGAGDSESGNEMTTRILSALLTMSMQDKSDVRRNVMDSSYDQDVLDEVDARVFENKIGGGDIPYEAWRASDPKLTSNPGNRSANRYRAVIDQFGVETNGRYKVNKKGQGDTYCNIFMWDVTKAMGAEIPHYVDPVTQAPREYPDTKGAERMTANKMYDWLHGYGSEYGWKKATAGEAQAYANAGRPAVTVWKNESGGHGHAQVVSPSADGNYDPRKGVAIAQAGRNLYNYANITQVYGSKRMDEVAYFVHE